MRRVNVANCQVVPAERRRENRPRSASEVRVGRVATKPAIETEPCLDRPHCLGKAGIAWLDDPERCREPQNARVDVVALIGLHKPPEADSAVANAGLNRFCALEKILVIQQPRSDYEAAVNACQGGGMKR